MKKSSALITIIASIVIFMPGLSFGFGGLGTSGGGRGGPFTAATGPYSFVGADGSTQFSTGATNSATEYLQAIGGITSAGGSIVAVGAAANVSINFTAKGTGNVNFGNNGSGQLAQAVDPGGAVSSGGQVQFTPSISSGPAKVGNATYGVNLDCGSGSVCQVGGQPLASSFPGYLVGNWYNTGNFGALNAGTAALNGKIVFYPAFIYQKITINALGVRVGTGSAGNAQAAVYANNPATMRPTGSALASTASMSTASAAGVNAVVSVQLTPGLYWFGTNIDNATATLISFSPGGAQMQSIIGSTTQATELGNQVALASVSTPVTFGTWGDVSGATFTESNGNANPVVQLKVGSIP